MKRIYVYMMRISILDVLCPGSNLDQKMAFVEDAGIDAIELNGEKLDHPADIVRIKETLGSSNVDLAAIHLAFRGEINSPFPSVRRQIVTRIQNLLPVCSDLGGSGIITIPSYRKRTRPLNLHFPRLTEKNTTRIIKEYRTLASMAEEYGLYIMIEPVDHSLTNFITTCRMAAEVCERTGSDLITLCPDLYHMKVEGEDITESLKKYKRMITHIHIDDWLPDRDSAVLPGYGCLPFTEIVRTLKEINFQRYLSIDCEIVNKDTLIKSVNLLEQWIKAPYP
jgi:sugar phosphate isomerase/epimerase